MAVITELIDAGLQLKRRGNLRGAIEHFRQLHATYPGNARIMFELAASWTAFEVPEQALPLYRELLALPKGQGLPPKDMPRLYTRLGATLLSMGEVQEALTVIDEGLRLHPSYRALRVWRIFALNSNEADSMALLDALELMLESLAPSRWDIFEDDIVAMVKRMRAAQSVGSGQDATGSQKESRPQAESPKTAAAEDAGALAEARRTVEISESADADQAADVEVDISVQVKKPKKKPRKRRRKQQSKPPQLGKKAVRIDISAAGDSAEDEPGDDDAPPPASGFKIPVDAD